MTCQYTIVNLPKTRKIAHEKKMFCACLWKMSVNSDFLLLIHSFCLYISRMYSSVACCGPASHAGQNFHTLPG